MKLKLKITVFLISSQLLLAACNKRCETFNPDGSYVATIHLGYGSTTSSPRDWDTTYTDILTVTTSASPFHLRIENWPSWNENGMSKTAGSYKLESGNEEADKKKSSKECIETAKWEADHVTGGYATMEVGKGSLTYDFYEGVGGSSGRITKICTIKAKRLN